MNIAIIGGGAAGFFLAIRVKELLPEAHVTVFEQKQRVLAKVAITGGGRCNVTNSFRDVGDLKNVYPRGHKLMKGLFKVFSPSQTFDWFESQGVRLVTQDDQCVFPQSQDAASIVGCLTKRAAQLGVEIRTAHSVTDIRPTEDGFRLFFANPKQDDGPAYRLVAVTTGGAPHGKGLGYLERMGHAVAEPIPSLFTFNLTDERLKALMGTVVENAQTALPGTKFRSSGPLLITYWGMSGPAILKLSSYAARYLQTCGYRCTLSVNWTGTCDETVAEALRQTAGLHARKQLQNVRAFDLPERLWTFLLEKAGLPADKRWGELGKKGLNRLTDRLCNDTYALSGRGTYREEFVTCGGISLDAVHRHSLESKVCPGLYFAGEVLDIDAITGGFNLQAAWTTGYAAAQAMADKVRKG